MNTKTQRLTICALLVALGVVFSRFLSIPVSLFGTYSLNIGFGMLPILLLCVLYGPIYGAIGATCWDLLGALLFPKGGFVIWFTLAATALGLVTGAFFASPESKMYIRRPASFGRTFLAVVCGQFIYSVFLNTLLIHVLYGVPVMALLIPRLIENCIMVFVNTILVRALLRALSGSFIITDKLPEDIRKMAAAPAPAPEYSTKDLLGMVGGYICNNDMDKAREILETVMLDYKKDPTSFTTVMRKDLAEYRMKLAKSSPDKPFIVVNAVFDIDAELDKLHSLTYAGKTQDADEQRAKISSYYEKNSSMFTEAHREKMRSLNMTV